MRRIPGRRAPRCRSRRNCQTKAVPGRWPLAAAFGVGVQLASAFGANVVPAVGRLNVPGMLAAALAFPSGVHSDYAVLYLVLAAALNIAFYASVFVGLLRLLQIIDQKR